MTPVMWLELDHTKHRCFVLSGAVRQNPAGDMHGVALHSLALCNFAESVRWHEKVPLSIVVAVPRVGGVGTKNFHAVSGGTLVMRVRNA